MTEFSNYMLLLCIKRIKLSLDGYISLNSFGYGGANGHLVLKPYRNHCSNQGEQLKQTGFIVLILWPYMHGQSFVSCKDFTIITRFKVFYNIIYTATSHKLVTIKARNELEMETIVEFVRKNKNDAASLALLAHSWLSHDPKRKVRGYVVTESGPKGKIYDVQFFENMNCQIFFQSNLC